MHAIEIVKQGLKLLKKEKLYQQKEIVAKLKTLGYNTTTSSLSKALNGKSIGMITLKKLHDGLLILIDKEMGMLFDKEAEAFVQKENKDVVEVIQPFDPFEKEGFEFMEYGRMKIEEKIKFMQAAQKEIIELGVRLNTFISYFTNRSSYEFAHPFAKLLERGLDVKLFILDPDYNGSHLYFEDRAKILPKEKKSPERIKEVIQEFRVVCKEFDLLKKKGTLQLFKYRHIPYNHFLIRDGNRRDGEMIVSHYLFGIKRADCPSMRIEKARMHDLYKRYWTSYQYLTKDAKEVDLS
ncbi:MAG: hypothetical protein MRY78_02555 [Saprospiraceae bacterium]|nr:hypothetical protein [Saprospiraceae bacterium]